MTKEKIPVMNQFEALVKTKLSESEFDTLADRLGSKTIRTQLLNNPAKARNEHLIVFAQALQQTAWTLYSDYGVGIAGISPTEAKHHEEVHAKLQKKNGQ